MRRALHILVILLGVWLAPSNARADTAAGAAADRPTLRLGVFRSPPLIQQEPDGTIRGFLGHLIPQIERQAGVRFQIRYFPTFADLFGALDAGHLDAAMPMMRTEQRAATYQFTPPLADLTLAIVAGDNAAVTGLSEPDLKGKRVAVAYRGAPDEYLSATRHAPVLVREAGDDDALAALAFGRADYTVMEVSRAAHHIHRLGLTHLRIVGKLALAYQPAIAMSTTMAPEVAQRLSQAVRQLDSRSTREIADQWLTSHLPRWYERTEVLAGGAGLVLMLATSLVTVAIYRRRLRRRDRQLADANALLSRTASAANICGWELDVGANSLRWSAGVTQLLGANVDAVMLPSEQALQYYSPGSREQVRNVVVQCIRTGQPFVAEILLQPAEGGAAWARFTGEAERAGGRTTRVFGTVQRIDEQKRQQLALERSEKLYRTLADHANDLITIHAPDSSARLRYLTPSIKKLAGYEPEELVGRPAHECWHPDDLSEVRMQYEAFLAGKPSVAVQYRLRRKDGSYIWLESNAKPVFDSEGRMLEFVAISRDVSERVLAVGALQASQARYRHLAYHDPLTGLPNRAAFMQQLDARIGEARQNGSCLALCFIDADNFKHVNDSLGHAAGDALLAELAKRLSCTLGGDRIVARLGGDEFVALATGSDAEALARELSGAVLGAFGTSLSVGGQQVYLGVSLGIAIFPDHAGAADGLLAAADAAMYAAKAGGRNTWRVYDPEMGRSMEDKRTTLHGLRSAFERDEFLLHYQPRIRLASGRCCGAEALLRRQTPEGLAGPAGFIRAAEESGFITTLGRWVLQQAARQSLAWREAGFGIPISVNVSAKQLQDEQFIPTLRELIAGDPRLPQYMELELTESALADDVDRATRTLGELKALGFRLQIDDFGTGYSSLAHLSSMPVDDLKIDRSFVSRLPHEHEGREIVRAIIALAKAMELHVIAEGVETAEQAAFLRDEGCIAAQGFKFSRAEPASQILAKYRGNHVEATQCGAADSLVESSPSAAHWWAQVARSALPA